MRPIIINFSIFILLSLSVYGQNDKEAIKILDKFSGNALGAPSVSIRFDLVTADQMENTKDTISGTVLLSKDKYTLELPDNTVWFNGETSWSYLSAEEEVTITNADRKDNSFQNRPSAVFTMYKKGYKCRLVESKPDSYIIDLYPEDIKSDILRVRLFIGKSLLDLKSMEYKKRDGLVVTLVVKDYNLKLKPGPDAFVFQQSKYKDAEVIDMR